MSLIIDQIEKNQLKPDLPSISSGDTVAVQVKVRRATESATVLRGRCDRG